MAVIMNYPEIIQIKI